MTGETPRICRRCGHEHRREQCPLCGQPIPEQLASEEQRRGYRQRLHLTVRLPRSQIETYRTWLEQADYLCEEENHLLATYREENLRSFLRLWEQMGEESDCELLFNGRRRPYDRELWIPLLWIAADA